VQAGAGGVINESLKKQVFDLVKKGEVDELIRLVRETGIELCNLIEDQKNFFQTPMFFATIIPNHDVAFKMCQVLIEMGVNPLKEDYLKQSPLFYASREGNIPVMKMLIDKGEDVNRRDKYDQTPIYYSVREGQVQVTQFLVDNGAIFDHADSQNKRPIYYAIQHDKYDMVDFLIKKGANLVMEDKKRMTPTHFANKHGRKEILELLLANGGVPLEKKTQNA